VPLDLPLELETPKLGADAQGQMPDEARLLAEHLPPHLCRRRPLVTADACQRAQNRVLVDRLGATAGDSPAECVELADELRESSSSRFALLRRVVAVPPRPRPERRGTQECPAGTVAGAVAPGDVALPVRDPAERCIVDLVVAFAARPTALEASVRPGRPSAAISRRWITTPPVLVTVSRRPRRGNWTM
jgi:hypothetical protein